MNQPIEIVDSTRRLILKGAAVLALLGLAGIRFGLAGFDGPNNGGTDFLINNLDRFLPFPDEIVRPGTTVETLAGLKPAFYSEAMAARFPQ